MKQHILFFSLACACVSLPVIGKDAPESIGSTAQPAATNSLEKTKEQEVVRPLTEEEKRVVRAIIAFEKS